MSNAAAATVRSLRDIQSSRHQGTRIAWKRVLEAMNLSRRLLPIAHAASAILLAACLGDATRHHQAAVVTTAAESQPAREDPVLAEQRRLTGELASLEKDHASLALSFSEQETEIRQADGALRKLKRDFEQQRAETDQYILEHQVQVACAFADQIARGEGEHSEKTRECARVAADYCAIAMLFGPFRSEVAAVKRQVDEAEARAQSLQTQIGAREEERDTKRAKLQAKQDELDRTAFEIASVRQKLAALGDGLPPDEVAGLEPATAGVTGRRSD